MLFGREKGLGGCHELPPFLLKGPDFREVLDEEARHRSFRFRQRARQRHP
jgi:hypothetical protein